MSESQSQDHLLIDRAQKGDRLAFNELIRKYEHRAYQYAFRLTRNQEEASDVVADAFVRIFNALHNFKSQSAFSTWLYRILTNCFLDLRKKEKNRSALSLELTVATDEGEIERQIEDPARNPYEESERHARQTMMEKALDAMPEYQRAMLVMYHSEDLSYEEIAAALDLPLGTVKSRLNRARISLRELLSKDEELFKL